MITTCFLFLGVTLLSLTATPPSPAPQPQSELPHMLEAEWSAGKHMPRGMQDNYVGMLGNWLISVGGFCGGADEDWKPGVYTRGFFNQAWGLNLEETWKDWVTLPPFPGAPRQGMQGACVGGSLYVWGGFSYSEPFTYADGFRLFRREGAWSWEPLPPLPSPTCWGGTVVLGTKIYTLGGADYDAQRFYAQTDRTGMVERLGARLIAFDTAAPDQGWTARTPCPGTPRCLTSMAVVEDKIYTVGGVTMSRDTGGYYNVVDGWRYDPQLDAWERLRDLPTSASGGSSSSIVYHGRYMLLPCGYQYGELMRPDEKIEPLYGTPSKVTRTWENHPSYKGTHYYNHFFVYDTKTNLFGTATALPFDDVSTITVVRGGTAYMFPGETAGFVWNGEYFGHHPEFVLKGALRELPWELAPQAQTKP